MAGSVQLQSNGSTSEVNPEFSYFSGAFKKSTQFSIFSRKLDAETSPDFGKTLRFVIPQNCGTFLTKLSLNMKLPGINTPDVCYIESVGHAIIEHARLYIGDQLIQHIPSDYLQIYSEHNVSLTHQYTLEERIGKYPLRVATIPVSDSRIIAHNNLGKDDTDVEMIVELPFYFYKHSSLALPISSIDKQVVEVEVKLRDYKHLLTDVNGTYPINNVNLKPLLNATLSTELILTEDKPKENQDYVITQIQQNKFDIGESENEKRFRLDFTHPVKELLFVIQREGVSPFDYDNSLKFVDDVYTVYENLKRLKLQLDDQVIISNKIGSVQFLKAVQARIHHSRTQLIRRFYSYSFALKPEEWFPTGQINFGHIKNQLLDVELHRCDPPVPRKLKVYALSYNVLNVCNGVAKLVH